MISSMKVFVLLLGILATSVAGFSLKFDQRPTIQNHIYNLLSVTTITTAIVTGTSTANAADVATGQKIFEQSCISCHAGGNNAIAKQRTLKQEALNEYLLNPQSGSDIAKFIKDSNVHRGALAFSAKLDENAYENVGQYVFTQAIENKW
jgi:cytochrome c6